MRDVVWATFVLFDRSPQATAAAPLSAEHPAGNTKPQLISELASSLHLSFSFNGSNLYSSKHWHCPRVRLQISYITRLELPPCGCMYPPTSAVSVSYEGSFLISSSLSTLLVRILKISERRTWDTMFKRLKSNHEHCESKWTFLPNLNKYSCGVLEITASQAEKQEFVKSQLHWPSIFNDHNLFSSFLSLKKSFPDILLSQGARCDSWDQSDLDLWSPNFLIIWSLSPTESLYNIRRNILSSLILEIFQEDNLKTCSPCSQQGDIKVVGYKNVGSTQTLTCDSCF